MKRKIISHLLTPIILLSTFLWGCGGSEQSKKPKNKVIRLATTTSTKGSGLLDILVPAFEKKYSTRLDVHPRGTGAALAMARNEEADVILVHARSEEDAFIAKGYGLNRRDVMYNDFVLLGPSSKVAEFKKFRLISESLRHIAKDKQVFITRGDNSGTSIREKSLWEQAKIEPVGTWYTASGKGMLATLKKASELQAYILSDRSTFLHNKDILNLSIVFEGDQQLYNPYGVIAVNPAKVHGVNFEGAMNFVDFITSIEGQRIIADFGKERFKEPLFTPMALNIR